MMGEDARWGFEPEPSNLRPHLGFGGVHSHPGCSIFLTFIMEGMGQRLRCPGSCGARGDPGSSTALPLSGGELCEQGSISNLSLVFPDEEESLQP